MRPDMMLNRILHRTTNHTICYQGTGSIV